MFARRETFTDRGDELLRNAEEFVETDPGWMDTVAVSGRSSGTRGRHRQGE
jgi:hypothetical protein